MLPIINYTLNELKTVFQKSWEWRIGYVLIGGFIIARWLGLFSNLELITLDFFLRNRLPEKRDDHVVIVLIKRDSVQGSEPLSDQQIVKLLNTIFAADPAVVGLNIFREESSNQEGRSDLMELFEIHENLIGVQKVLPPQQIPPIRGGSKRVSQQQFGLNDIPIDKDGKVRRVFVGAILPDDTETDSSDNRFGFSFSFKIAEKYLESQGYSLENFPSNPEIPSFLNQSTGKYTKIPILSQTFGGYIRDRSIAKVQTLLNFRSGTDSFTIIDAADLLNGKQDVANLSGKAVIVGGMDSFFPRFLPVSASSNLVDKDSENRDILPRIGITGVELEAHAASQIINAALHSRPLVNAIHPFYVDGLIVLAGIAGILIGNAFRQTQATIRNASLLTISIFLLLISSYGLLCRSGTWLPVFPASSILAITGITYIAFYQSERLAIMEAKKLEEERRKAIERTFNSIHAGPLQTLASLLRNVRDGKLDQAYLISDLEALNREIRSIGERLRQDAIEEVFFIDSRRNIKLDLNHPMHEVFYEVYNLCLQKELPGFQGIKVRSVTFEPFDCKVLKLETKQKLCLFLQEALENVGKHAQGTTRLLVSGKVLDEFYTLCVEDNGPGITSSHMGEGTKFFYRLEEVLRGKFSRTSKPTGGTVCKLTWSLCDRTTPLS